MMTQVLKRRRDDDGDTYDIDGNGQGAKHWTDEEKTKLFTWLMGQGQDEHWNALRATKNSCLREVSVWITEICIYLNPTSARLKSLGARKPIKPLKVAMNGTSISSSKSMLLNPFIHIWEV